MTSHSDAAGPRPLRLWPGLVLAALMLPLRFVLPVVWADGVVYAVIGSVVCGLLVIGWWTFFSRAPRVERWGGAVLMVLTMAATWQLAHVSMATGAMGALIPMLVIPLLGFVLPLGAAAASRLPATPRRASLALTILLAGLGWTLVRTDGMTSTMLMNDFHWRWTPTAEDRLLANEAVAPLGPSVAPDPAVAPPAAVQPAISTSGAAAAEAPATAALAEDPVPVSPPVSLAQWPGFRGAARDSIVRGVRIETDWDRLPPTALWRRPVGPGWSSFAVSGDRIYTQEQRGEEEIVACYSLSTGEPLWAHRDPVRFWESNGGAGPRATPTLAGGRVYAFGATGILNALDASTGRSLWSRNVSSDASIRVPDWGFASSPLVVGSLVVVAAEGKLMAYDAATGAPRWSGADTGAGYSSPHLVTIKDVPQIVLLTGRGATGVAPGDGAPLWTLTVPANALSATIVQPALTADGELLVADGDASGMRRVAVARVRSESSSENAEGWTVTERWRTNGLKPFFDDFVVHNGHAYGFDGTILSAIDLVDGRRVWKGGRYGNGQLILLADQDLLLVTSEEGELVLVSATPDTFTEIARAPGIEGKTWNHPALAGDVLLVRNGEEMAAFKLRLK